LGRHGSGPRQQAEVATGYGAPSPGKVQNGAIHHLDVANYSNHAAVTTPAAERLGSTSLFRKFG